MRILIANWSARQAGGAETYLDELIPSLASRGHRIGFLCETDAPADRPSLTFPPDVSRWTAAESSRPDVLAGIASWRPHVLFVHQLQDPGFEEDLVKLAPAILFAHDYHGTCVSGGKAFKFPAVRPCRRRFGWQCLLHYYPHRCGGLNPITMTRCYRTERSRNRLLPRYAAIVTASEHMRREFLNHGMAAQSVRKLTHFVRPQRDETCESYDTTAVTPEAIGWPEREIHLLFLGRMDYLKGGRLLLDALPRVAAALRSRVHVTMAGDGPDRSAWERKGKQIQSGNAGIAVEFCGWVAREAITQLFRRADLLVLPSVWPEPFGQVGLEAGLCGVPTVAFDVGGIPEWLRDGVNGYLAPGSPPDVSGLADTIVKALADPTRHAQLRKGAIERAREFTLERHVDELETVFEGAVSGRVGIG